MKRPLAATRNDNLGQLAPRCERHIVVGVVAAHLTKLHKQVGLELFLKLRTNE